MKKLILILLAASLIATAECAHAIVLQNPGPQYVVLGNALNFDLQATEVQGHTEYDMSGNPPSPLKLAFRGIPPYNQPTEIHSGMSGLSSSRRIYNQTSHYVKVRVGAAWRRSHPALFTGFESNADQSSRRSHRCGEAIPRRHVGRGKDRLSARAAQRHPQTQGDG